MKTISFINIKGGVGKTATSITVGHILATYFGKKVLLVDADPQGNMSTTYSAVNIMSVLKNLLIGEKEESELPTIEDLLLKPEIETHLAIRNTEYNNLDIIPALLTLSEAEKALKEDFILPQQYRLKNHLEKIKDEYDYCIIDCSPSVNIVNINALVASDIVYVPMKCDAWSGIGMCVARDYIKMVSSYNYKLKFGGFFYVQWEKNKNVSTVAYQLFKDNLGEELLPCSIRKSKLIEEMSYMQKPLLEYDKKGKGGKYSPVTEDYIKLTEYIMSQ